MPGNFNRIHAMPTGVHSSFHQGSQIRVSSLGWPLDCLRPCRKRLWAGGNFGMAQTLFADVDCWLKHMTLDNDTGVDVPGINLRAAVGLEAVDYFVPGYAVWAKLVEALADLGYDSNNLVRRQQPRQTSHVPAHIHGRDGWNQRCFFCLPCELAWASQLMLPALWISALASRLIPS